MPSTFDRVASGTAGRQFEGAADIEADSARLIGWIAQRDDPFAWRPRGVAVHFAFGRIAAYAMGVNKHIGVGDEEVSFASVANCCSDRP